MNSVEKEKTEDKKEIEEEEREKMLNEENKKLTEKDGKENGELENGGVETEDGKVSTGEVERKRKALEEATKKEDKGRIPIGGIRMPGFLQRRAKDKSKSEPDPEEGVDLLEDQPAASKHADGEAAAPENNGGVVGSRYRSLRKMLPAMPKVQMPTMSMPSMPAVPALRPHLASIKLSNPFNKKAKEKDVEAGPTVTSEGTTEPDSTPVQETEGDKAKEAMKDSKEEDGMETVQLDADEKVDPEKAGANGDAMRGAPLWDQIRNYKHKFVAAAVLSFFLLLIIIIAIAVSGPRHDFARGPVSDGKYATAGVQCGLVQGVLEHGAYTFRGIPYARPPVGDLRWKPAQPLNNLEHCWNGTFLAHNSSNFCWQSFPEDQSVSVNGAEDCLTLDVFTPQVSYENLLPVVVVIGSSHVTGGSTTPLLQPTAKLSRAKEVVFVRPNFRLGVLGFLASRSLSRSTHPPTSGNYGLSDIKVALEWVQLNIAAFGGDPKVVTVLGYRTGATLVTALTSFPSAKGLMKRVWVTSGSADFPGKPLSESENEAASFVESLRKYCPDNSSTSSSSEVSAECLRSIEAEDLLDAVPDEWKPTTPDLPPPIGLSGMPNTHQWLVLDGEILRTHPSEVWEKWETEGKGSPLQMVIGATAHADASVELYRNVSDGEEKAIKDHIQKSVLGQMNLTEVAINRYNATWPGFASLVSDLRTVCPLNALATKMPTSAYFYVATFPISGFKGCGRGRWSNFPKRSSGKTKWPAPPLDCEVSKSEDEMEYQEPLAELGIDVAAIMGRVEGATPEERRYITAMQQLFYQFVRFGELHHGSETYSGRVMVVDQDTLPRNEYPNCNFWIQQDAVPRFGHRN